MLKYRFGKLPAVKDSRTIPLKSIIKKELLPPLPATYNLDEALGGVEDHNVYANDRYGNCVIAARAHQTLRFEKFEQGQLLNITDQEVIDQYFKETGGPDIGLFLLSSLKKWRKEGWTAAGQQHHIYAFASVDPKDHEEVKYGIYLLGGINYGFLVPKSCMDQFEQGQTWTVVEPDGGTLGGHAVYLYQYIGGYTELGPVCMTWGVRQQMSWDFWDKYTDEAYAIVDNKNDWQPDSPLDIEKLEGYLKDICGEDDIIDDTSNCPVARAYAGIGNWLAGLFGRDTRLKAYKPNEPALRLRGRHRF